MRTWAILLLLTGICAGCPDKRGPVLQPIASFDTKGWAHDAVAEAQRLYVADRQGGYLIFDRSRGWARPAVHAPVADVISLAPNNGSPVLAARFDGLVLMDRQGRISARSSLGEIANAVAIREDCVFAAYGAHGLVVARLMPGNIETLASLPTAGWAHDVKLRGHFAYVADWNYGLQVVDIHNPRRPVEAGRLPTAATAISVAFGDRDSGLVALAEGHAGVSIARVDAAGRPTRLGRHELGLQPAAAPHPESGGWAHGVAWAGPFIFVANWKGGLVVLDTADPTRPAVVLTQDTSGTALGVAAEREPGGSILVYLADGEAGLRVFRFAHR